MRRDYVTLTARHVDAVDDQIPTAELAVDDAVDALAERFVTAAGGPLEADDVDVAYRLQTRVDDAEATGVFSLSNRVTGEFLFEVNAPADAVLELVDAARDSDTGDTDASYRVAIRQDGDDVATYEKRTLLVYDEEGSLLRQHSLIPSGVEL